MKREIAAICLALYGHHVYADCYTVRDAQSKVLYMETTAPFNIASDSKEMALAKSKGLTLQISRECPVDPGRAPQPLTKNEQIVQDLTDQDAPVALARAIRMQQYQDYVERHVNLRYRIHDALLRNAELNVYDLERQNDFRTQLNNR